MTVPLVVQWTLDGRPVLWLSPQVESSVSDTDLA